MDTICGKSRQFGIRNVHQYICFVMRRPPTRPICCSHQFSKMSRKLKPWSQHKSKIGPYKGPKCRSSALLGVSDTIRSHYCKKKNLPYFYVPWETTVQRPETRINTYFIMSLFFQYIEIHLRTIQYIARLTAKNGP